MVIAGRQITKRITLRALGIATVVLVAGGILTYFGLIWREKQQFTQAEKEIDALYAQIVEKVGKPDQEKKEKSCGYASRVYSKGPLGCSVSTYFVYTNKDILKSNALLREGSELLGVSPGRYTLNEKTARGEYEYEFKELTDGRSFDRSLSASLKTKSEKSCSVEFTYPATMSSYVNIFGSALSENNLVIGLSCGGSAMTEHFPVKK